MKDVLMTLQKEAMMEFSMGSSMHLTKVRMKNILRVDSMRL